MLTISDLEKSLGMSYEQVRVRINQLRESFPDAVTQGKRGKLLVTDRGLAMLRRIADLEKEGFSLEAALGEVLTEVEEPPTKANKIAQEEPDIGLELLRETIDMLKNQLSQKDAQLQQRDEELQRLHDLLNRQLPPVSEGRKSRWQFLKSVMTGKEAA